MISIESKMRIYERWLSLRRSAPALWSEGPWQLGARSWVASVTRTLRGAIEDDYAMAASAIAFSSFLALLPLLAAVALVYGTLEPPEQVVRNVRSLMFILPADARSFIGNWLIEAVTRDDGRGVELLFATGIGSLSALRAGRSIIAGLNIAFDVDHRRGFFRGRFIALVVVFTGALILLGALVAISVFAWIENAMPAALASVLPTLRAGFWTTAALAAAAVLSLAYRVVPNRSPPQWRWVLPGATAATAIWLAATFAFGAYLANFGSARRMYGSVGAIVVLQIWLLVSSFLLLLGAKLNAELMRSAGVDGESASKSA